MLTRTIKRDGEQFTVAIQEDQKQATVTDEHGTVVTIRYSSGNLDVRLPNGWGSWVSSMEAAVERAVRLCIESRTQLTPKQAYEEMVEFVQDKED